MRVVYLLNSFPNLSETFIVNELNEFLKFNPDTLIFSFSKSDTKQLHTKAVNILNRVIYFPKTKNYKKRCLTNLARFSLRSPIKVFYTLYLSLKFKRFRWFFLSFLWAKEIETFRVQHIHVHFVSRATNVARFISILTGIPYSFTSHAEDMYRCAYEGREAELVDLSNHAKFHVTVCKYNMRFLEENFPGLDTSNLRLAYCGVDPGQFRFHPLSKGYGFTILSVGRLVEKKGFAYLIQACRSLKDQIDFRCNIIGDGPVRAKLEALIEEFNLKDQVVLTGAKTQQEIARALEGCDLFVLPCIDVQGEDLDSCPVVLKEAMCVGKPVISTSISGIPELVREAVGILIPERDAGALAKAIRRTYQMSESERHRMGQAGRGLIEKEFNLHVETEKLYQWMLNGGGLPKAQTQAPPLRSQKPVLMMTTCFDRHVLTKSG